MADVFASIITDIFQALDRPVPNGWHKCDCGQVYLIHRDDPAKDPKPKCPHCGRQAGHREETLP